MKHKRIWSNKIYLKMAILIKWEIWDFKMRMSGFKTGLGKKNEFISIHEHLENFWKHVNNLLLIGLQNLIQ